MRLLTVGPDWPSVQSVDYQSASPFSPLIIIIITVNTYNYVRRTYVTAKTRDNRRPSYSTHVRKTEKGARISRSFVPTGLPERLFLFRAVILYLLPLRVSSHSVWDCTTLSQAFPSRCSLLGQLCIRSFERSCVHSVVRLVAFCCLAREEKGAIHKTPTTIPTSSESAEVF